MDRRFRFGLVASNAGSLPEWQDIARKAEDLGYSTLFIADHFGAQLAPIPAAMAAAAATKTIRVGTFVLDNDFRHPAAVAKEAATAQLLTGLYALKNETLGGMAVGLTYKQGAPNPVHCWFQMGTSNGQWTLPAGLTPQCLSS